MSTSDIRVRIAPSPSGFLHIGTAKMALFNWLFARKHGGAFVLRLEDTDASRTEEQYVQAMCEGFHWLGIDWDEGPEFGDVPHKGDHGPYRQSLRKDLYYKEAHRLVDEGKAYKCFCAPEDFEALKKKAEEEGRRESISCGCRGLSAGDVSAKNDAPYAIRFMVPEGETVVEDIVQGDVKTNNKEYDDFVILRRSGDPVFHLAVVVDDGTMQISHIIRGDDHLTNAARHVMLFNALGYPLPQFAHLPMVLDERGKKYSKREHGANVLDWRADGYLPEALINYVALLGWTPEEENRELFTRSELVDAFTIKRLGKSAAKFDRKKLDWLNGQHLRMLPLDNFRDRILPVIESAGLDTSSKADAWLTKMASIVQEKIPTLNAVVEQVDFFFVEPDEYEEKGVKKQFMKEGALDKLEAIRQVFTDVESFEHEALHTAFQTLAEQSGVGLGQFIHPTRLALTGKTVGPGLFELAELLGHQACLQRVDKAINFVKALEG